MRTVLHFTCNSKSLKQTFKITILVSPLTVHFQFQVVKQVDDIVEGREDMKHHQDTVFQIISPVKEHPVSLQEIHNGCERIKRSLFKTEDEIAEVESQTRTQSAWQEVYKHRFGRETASESHKVGCTHKVGTSPSKIIKEVLYSDNNYIVSVTGHER